MRVMVQLVHLRACHISVDDVGKENKIILQHRIKDILTYSVHCCLQA
jgi:hypothetical protein